MSKGGPVLVPADSRGISLNSVVEKIYERILLWRSADVLGRGKPLRDEQGGFRKGHSVAHWIWALRENMLIRPRWVVVLIDLLKAFDKVWRKAMLWKLRMMGLDTAEWHAIDVLFERVSSTVRMDGWYSKVVDLCNGLKQGGIVSPWAFIVFLDDLAEELFASGFGTEDECRRAAFFLFVDDVGLIADDFKKAQCGVDVVLKWSNKWGMGVSKKKSVYLSNIRKGKLMLDGEELRRVTSERYLGFYLSANRKNTAHEKFLLNLVKSKVATITRTGLLIPQMGIKDGLLLWRALVHSVIYWAVGAWQPTSTFLGKIDKMKRRFARRLLGVSACTCNTAVEGELGLLRAEDDACIARLMFWGSIVRSPNLVLIKLREREDTELWKLVAQDLWDLAIPNQIYLKAEWKKVVTEAVERRASLRWREMVLAPSKLDWYRELKPKWGRETYTNTNDLGDISAYAALRTGGNDLNIEMGRWWPRIERPNRRCPLCAKEIEDVEHVLGTCEWYNQEREEFVERMVHGLNTDWQVKVIGGMRAGLTVCGASSPSVIQLERLQPKEQVKYWLGCEKEGMIPEEDALIIRRQAVPFCRKVMAKRRRLLLEGKGNAFAARIVSKGVNLAYKITEKQ